MSGGIKIFGPCWALSFAATPFISFTNRMNPAIYWVLLCLAVILNQTFAAACFSTDCVLLANSVDDDIRGQLMGFRQSTVGLARSLGSILGGIVFSESFRHIPQPGNVLVP